MSADRREKLEDFLAYLQLEKGLSQNTVESYQSDLQQFEDFLGELHPRKGGWETVEGSDVRDWLYDLSEKDLSNASLCRKLSAVRALDRFLLSEESIRKSFTEVVDGPALRRKSPHVLTIGEMERLLAAPDTGTALGLRDAAILELFYSSGVRVSELIALKLQDVSLEAGALKVFGKGSKERICPLGTAAIASMCRYLEVGRPALVKAKTGSVFFLSSRGTGLSRKMIWVLVKKYAKLAGIEKPVKPHMMRHSFATHLLSGGADLRVIQEFLGHADISTTQIYTTVEASRVRDAHAEHHPRSRDRVDL